jgi:hypothetical protein
MSDDALRDLLPAMEMAVFQRSADGSFLPLTALPAWFPRLADGTFPFLGHILDEAYAFWSSGKDGRQNWGPSVGTNDAGTEFHYTVSAVTTDGRQYLVFQIDRGSDRVREILQTIRDQKLDDERARHTRAALAADVRQAGTDLFAVIGRLESTSPTSAQRELLDKLAFACDSLVATASKLS